MAKTPARSSKPASAAPNTDAGPTDFTDPVLRSEVKRAAVWIGMAVLVGLTIYLAQPLLVIFGGMVFAAMIDGGARLLGRVLPIGRGWRVALVLLLASGFMGWTFWFTGSQIAAEAAALPATIETQAMRAIAWLQSHGFKGGVIAGTVFPIILVHRENVVAVEAAPVEFPQCQSAAGSAVAIGEGVDVLETIVQDCRTEDR